MTELTASNKLRVVFSFCIAALAAIIFAGCGTLAPKSAAPDSADSGAGAVPLKAGVLQVGDLVRIDISGSGNSPQQHEEHIRGDGTISLYLVGAVKAAGKSPGDLQKEIQDLYVPRFYKNLNVTVRPADQLYYVGGQ